MAQPADARRTMGLDFRKWRFPMPARFWSHPCCSGDAIWRRVAECGDCGEKNGLIRWMLTGHEAEARYEYTRGLKSRGAHRRMADELLAGPLLRAGAEIGARHAPALPSALP